MHYAEFDFVAFVVFVGYLCVICALVVEFAHKVGCRSLERAVEDRKYFGSPRSW